MATEEKGSDCCGCVALCALYGIVWHTVAMICLNTLRCLLLLLLLLLLLFGAWPQLNMAIASATAVACFSLVAFLVS